MPATLEAPTEPNLFGDLIPKDYGTFADLVPNDPLTKGVRAAGAEDFGLFQDLVPKSPTSETEKAVAATPVMSEFDKTLLKVEKSVPVAPGILNFHASMNALRSLSAGAGKYIFEGLQGFEQNRAKLLKNPPTELTQPLGDEIVLPDGSIMSQEQQNQLEQRYHDAAVAQIPDAKAQADYFKQIAQNADTSQYVDPALANTIPARIAHAAGSAGVMALESLIPYAGIPLMVYHGALATEAEAKNAGKTDAEAEAAGVRSAIGLALFGGASKLAALGVAQILPSGASSLRTFLSQFAGQEIANETSSRAIDAWGAASDAPDGKKVEAALNALKDTTLEQSTLNTVYALAHASNAAGKEAVRPPSAPEPRIQAETPEVVPVTAGEPIEQAPMAEVLKPDAESLSLSPYDLERNRPAGAQTVEEAQGLPTSRSTSQRFTQPEGAAIPDQSQTTASITRDAIKWRKGLIQEGEQLGEQVAVMRGMGIPIPSPLADRISQINTELKRGYQPPEPQHYQLRGEPDASQENKFVPSTEWQEIPKGTVLPNGGEYRFDQATGKNFAKWSPENVKEAQDALQVVSPAEEIPRATETRQDQGISSERVGRSEQGNEVAGTPQAQEPIGVADAIAEIQRRNAPSTTGIAQRVHDVRATEGRQGEILPGEGVTAEEMVQRGRDLLNTGADPEKIIAGVSAGKAVTGDEMAVLRAQHEQFSHATDQAADALRKTPSDPVAKQNYENAFNAETDFAQRIKPAATEWHKVGQSMQGETEIQTGTFTGLRRAFHAITGRDVTPKEAVKLDKTATKVQKANSAVEKAKSDFSEVVKKATKNTMPKTAEELRTHFSEKFKKMLPC